MVSVGHDEDIDPTNEVDVETLIMQITSEEEEEEKRAAEYPRRPLQELWQRKLVIKMNTVRSPVSYPYPSIVSCYHSDIRVRFES